MFKKKLGENTQQLINLAAILQLSIVYFNLWRIAKFACEPEQVPVVVPNVRSDSKAQIAMT